MPSFISGIGSGPGREFPIEPPGFSLKRRADQLNLMIQHRAGAVLFSLKRHAACLHESGKLCHACGGGAGRGHAELVLGHQYLLPVPGSAGPVKARERASAPDAKVRRGHYHAERVEGGGDADKGCFYTRVAEPCDGERSPDFISHGTPGDLPVNKDPEPVDEVGRGPGEAPEMHGCRDDESVGLDKGRIDFHHVILLRAVTPLLLLLDAPIAVPARPYLCLLYTSDAADDLLCVDLGGRRIIKKKKKHKKTPKNKTNIYKISKKKTHIKL